MNSTELQRDASSHWIIGVSESLRQEGWFWSLNTEIWPMEIPFITLNIYSIILITFEKERSHIHTKSISLVFIMPRKNKL